MVRAFIGFFLGLFVGTAMTIGAWHFFDMRIPFTREMLERDSDLKLFVHDAVEFTDGVHDMDTYHTWFSFRTSIASPQEYFDRVDAAVRDAEWKLLDSTSTFRLYASDWDRSGRNILRLENRLRFDPQTRAVSFEQQRQYE